MKDSPQSWLFADFISLIETVCFGSRAQAVLDEITTVKVISDPDWGPPAHFCSDISLTSAVPPRNRSRGMLQERLNLQRLSSRLNLPCYWMSSTGSHTCLYHNCFSTLFDTTCFMIWIMSCFPFLLPTFLSFSNKSVLLKYFLLDYASFSQSSVPKKKVVFSQFAIIYVCSACREIRAAICLVHISRSVVEKLQKNMMGCTDWLLAFS